LPFSYTEYTGDGSTTDFAITFDYLDRDHVFVTVAGLKTTDVSSLYEFSFVNDTTVRVVLSADGTSAVPSATTIRVGRDTNIDNPPVTWTEGAALTTTDLNKLSNYLTYALQESLDANEGAALATLAQEAAEAAQALAEAAQSGAETAETNAETAQGLAEAAQTAAEAAQTAAEAAQGLAETARDKAQDWAEELEDVEVETGQYSAFHWAEKASASAAAAAASAASIGPDADFDSLTLTPGTGGGDLEIVSADNTSTGAVNFSDQAAADQGFVRYDTPPTRWSLALAGGRQCGSPAPGALVFRRATQSAVCTSLKVAAASLGPRAQSPNFLSSGLALSASRSLGTVVIAMSTSVTLLMKMQVILATSMTTSGCDSLSKVTTNSL